MADLSLNLLRNVNGVGGATIRAFMAAGYQSLNDLEDVTADDLMNVQGVGEATAEAILDFLDSAAADDPVRSYRHEDKRKNIPPAALAGQGKVEEAPPTRYFYDPHLDPVLRFDETGEEDRLPPLLQKVRREKLSDDEVQTLAEALRNHQPWLEWSGKREKRWFDVDPVALHIHERVSAEAIIAAARRKPIQRSLFADPELEYREAIKFYEHEMDWSNRLILGDSLTVMHSLAKREDLAGKVQMIYVDPPYGIKFASNFQPLVNERDVKDRAADLTREPEQVKAYRDTWKLGLHSYLAYLRDRFIVAKELLADSGSIFVQISDENTHRVRLLLDEVFGVDNFIAQIAFTTTSGRGANFIDAVFDTILWYSRDRSKCKYRELYEWQTAEDFSGYDYVGFENGAILRKSQTDEEGRSIVLSDATSQGETTTGSGPLEFDGSTFWPTPGRHWSTTERGMRRLWKAERLFPKGKRVFFVRYADDYPVRPLRNIWLDTQLGGYARASEKIYVVQTAQRVIERCMLMSTDPGDLVLDPTCGSGTTAYTAEKWGRRWITIDTSRVAVALARQRLLTSKYDYFELAHASGVSNGFNYKSAPHITLKSISQNTALDSSFEKWDPILDEKLERLNLILEQHVTPELLTTLEAKLVAKERAEGKRAITEADVRRWLLRDKKWRHSDVPFDTDPDWPEPLKRALEDYRQAWRQKMDEVNETIAASAPQEVLVDQPKVVKNVLRVSGPFTVEGVQPVEQSFDADTPIGGAPEDLDKTFEVWPAAEVSDDPVNAEAYLEKMVQLLRKDGVRFPDNKEVSFERLDPLSGEALHAEGEWVLGGETRQVAVAFGPQYGPITARQVEECLWRASRRGYDDLVLAGFAVDGAAQALIQDDPNPRVRCHLAHIRPDVNMGDLLKDTPSSQLFTVFGEPRVRLEETQDGEYVVHMEGVDIYDPVNNTIRATKAGKVAAWFLDANYDGGTFCVSQAFFPDKDAWNKLAKALKTLVDPQRFAAFSGTKSLPFEAGKHKRAAVKVIDPRGNEVMRVLHLDGEVNYG